VNASKNKYSDLLKNIGSTIETGRSNALSALNEQLLLTYWEIGRRKEGRTMMQEVLKV